MTGFDIIADLLVAAYYSRPMSSKQRAAAEKLAARYAKAFGVVRDQITILYLPNDDAIVSAPGLPEWSLGPIR